MKKMLKRVLNLYLFLDIQWLNKKLKKCTTLKDGLEYIQIKKISIMPFKYRKINKLAYFTIYSLLNQIFILYYMLIQKKITELHTVVLFAILSIKKSTFLRKWQHSTN